ncbi:hypothetical protein ACFWA9_16135 [Kitasatospora sp. NPDC059973]|uniref:hypothetical protein n=1 Tax=Kitasatospora sp. NPDC059973 TaxID=3347020 RepID=UPI0036740BB5
MTAPLSSPDPVGAHPSVDELADLAEELVEPAAAEALRTHLAGCADCRETAEALAELATLLAGAPAPVMPADIAARLDAALAAAAADADPADPGTPRTTAPDGPHTGTGAPSRSVDQAAAPRPATAPLGPPRRPATANSATGPGRHRPRRRRAAVLLGAAAALLAVGLGSSLLLRPAERQTADTASARAAATAPSAGPKAQLSTGGTAYQDDRLAAQVQQLLARTGATPDGRAETSGSAAPPADGGPGLGPGATRKPSASSAPAPTDGGPGLGQGGSAPACPAPADGPLLASERGSYAGDPAELLVYGVPGRADRVDVYLRAPDCGPVLLHRTIPAP